MFVGYVLAILNTSTLTAMNMVTPLLAARYSIYYGLDVIWDSNAPVRSIKRCGVIPINSEIVGIEAIFRYRWIPLL